MLAQTGNLVTDGRGWSRIRHCAQNGNLLSYPSQGRRPDGLELASCVAGSSAYDRGEDIALVRDASGRHLQWIGRENRTVCDLAGRGCATEIMWPRT